MYTSVRILMYTAGMFLVFFGVLQYVFPAPCKAVVTYSIGALDKRFGLSREEFLQSIEKAEMAWEKPFGKELFAYADDADIAVNLVYDDRQEKSDRAKKLTSSLDQTEKTREDIKRQYDNAYATYQKMQEIYTADIVSYEANVLQLNTDVENTNNAGGASEEEYKQFQGRQRALTNTRDLLQKKQANLNKLASDVNALADTESKVVRTYNSEVEKLHEEFGGDREFGQGEYTGKTITIYEFTDAKDLQLVLEHELGHALGIGHLSNPNSVMYYLAHKNNVALGGPTEGDVAALAAQCKKTSFTILLEHLQKGSTIKNINTFNNT